MLVFGDLWSGSNRRAGIELGAGDLLSPGSDSKVGGSMKKYLFVSNGSKPSREQQMSREKVILTNVSIPCVEAALDLEYKVFKGINRVNVQGLECDYPITFYNSNTYRSLFDLRSNYIAFRNLLAVLRSESIDVIHCNTPIGGLVGRLCGKIAKTSKIIYTAHGFHFYKGAPLIARLLYKTAEKWMARYTDVIITMNQEDYQAAKRFRLRNNGNVYFVHGVGVATSDFQSVIVDQDHLRESLGLGEDTIILISMGDLIPRKNYSSSIRALARTQCDRTHLLICGKGPSLRSLQDLALELNVHDRVHFLGFRKDIKELLTLADIFLFTTYQEGLPRSMMEAMAAGLPCVASKVRGNVDLISNGEGGFLCHPDDVDGLAKAIDTLALDSELRQSMGSVNLEKIQEYDIENVRKEIRSIFERELAS